MNILGKRSDLPKSRKSDRKKEETTVSFTHVQNIICSQTLSQTELDDIAHEQTIICRQLFAGHVVGSRPMKRKKNFLPLMKGFSLRLKIDQLKYWSWWLYFSSRWERSVLKTCRRFLQMVYLFQRPTGMCRWMGSHFHDRIDFNGVALSTVTIMGLRFCLIFGVRQFFILTVSKRTRMFVMQMESKVFFIQSKKWVNS